MFQSNRCINGLAHGGGNAVRMDGSAFIAQGRFVLGKMVEGNIVLLSTSGSTPGPESGGGGSSVNISPDADLGTG